MSNERDVLNCGHPPTPSEHTTGIARTQDGKTLCFPCAEKEELKAFLGAKIYSGYVNEEKRRITTWTGGELASIIDIRYSVVRYSTYHGPFRMRYVLAKDSNGDYWSGMGKDEWSLVTLRKIKKNA